MKVVNGGYSKDDVEAETSGTNADVVVVKAPLSSVVTITKPESVSTLPSPSVVVQVVVNVV